jgi:hypothetical protein
MEIDPKLLSDASRSNGHFHQEVQFGQRKKEGHDGRPYRRRTGIGGVQVLDSGKGGKFTSNIRTNNERQLDGILDLHWPGH